MAKFKNESRLLSDDEQELIRVLDRMREHIVSLNKRVSDLETAVELMSNMLVIKSGH